MIERRVASHYASLASQAHEDDVETKGLQALRDMKLETLQSWHRIVVEEVRDDYKVTEGLYERPPSEGCKPWR